MTADWRHALLAAEGLPDLTLPHPVTDDMRTGWRQHFSDHVYGPLLPRPPVMDVTRHALPGAQPPSAPNGAQAAAVERVRINMQSAHVQFDIDCALWTPPHMAPDTPVIFGLGFLGPLGVLPSDSFPIDPKARVYTRPELGHHQAKLTAQLRGVHAYRWPVDLLTRAGYAVMLSCYGSWAPDCPDTWRSGVARLWPDTGSGAIALWSSGYAAMIDAAQQMGLAQAEVFTAGHSRLAKAALWHAACDTRVSLVFANNSGAFGAAPQGHKIGETSDDLTQRFPHWLRASPHMGGLDQHHLLACIAPRATYLANATEDIWADPLGQWHALSSAYTLPTPQHPTDWPEPPYQLTAPNAGYHLRTGDHEMLPADWQHLLTFAKHWRSRQDSNLQPAP